MRRRCSEDKNDLLAGGFASHLRFAMVGVNLIFLESFDSRVSKIRIGRRPPGQTASLSYHHHHYYY